MPRGTAGTEGEAARRAAWLAARRTCITATDAAKILGVSKWGGPVDVWMDKTGKAVEQADTGALRFGRRFERPILEEYSEAVAPLVLAEPYTLLTALLEPRIGATLDACRETQWTPLAEPLHGTDALHKVFDGRPVDAKNTRHATGEWGESGTDRMPLYYATQLAVQMYVKDSDNGDLAVLFGGNEFRYYTLQRDRETEAAIVAQLVDFWQRYVVADVPPPLDGSKSYAAYLADRFNSNTAVILRADATLAEVAHTLRVTRAQLAELEVTEREAENAIKAAIGEARGIEGVNFRALWPQSKDRVSVDWEAIARDLATERETHELSVAAFLAPMIARYSTTKPGSRSFRVTFNGE